MLKTFEQWRAERNHVISNDSYCGELLMNAPLEEMSDDQKKRNVTLIDKISRVFRNLNSALNFVLKERAAQELGVGPR